MRARAALLHRSRLSLLQVETRQSLAFSSSSRRFPRSPGRNVLADNLRTKQLSSSAGGAPEGEPPVEEPVVEEKPVRRRSTRTSSKSAEKENDVVDANAESTVLKSNMHEILWQSGDKLDDSGYFSSQRLYDAGLPEPWLLQDAYETLLLALHPQTQHRATYPSTSAVEPVLGLYCPLEGGEYVVDATVRYLAQRAKADVVVVDAVELSAGDHGRYGKASSVIQFPDNPLRVSSPSSLPQTRSTRQSSPREDDVDEEEESSQPVLVSVPTRFSIQIPSESPVNNILRAARGATGIISPLSRGGPVTMQKMKAFFDELLTLTNPSGDASGTNEKDSDVFRRPRIVYVRDFGHISGQLPSWFPALQAAVRSRRQGPMSRPTSPVTGPTVIILGSTPPLSLAPQQSASPPSTTSRILSLLAQAGGRQPSSPKTPRTKSSWAEDDRKSRERRNKDRLKRWHKGDEALLEFMPPFSTVSIPSNSVGRRAHGFPVGSGSEFMVGDSIFIPVGRDGGPSNGRGSSSGDSEADGYFRVVGLVPRSRNEVLERHGRLSRRLKMNELALKLAVSEAGGLLVGSPQVSLSDLATAAEAAAAASALSVDPSSSTSLVPFSSELPTFSPSSFINSCLVTLKPWRELKAVADAAVGSVLSSYATNRGIQPADSSIEPTIITWEQVVQSVESSAESASLRNAWIDGVGEEDGGVAEEVEELPLPEVDEVIEAVRKDPDLDQHEQRLLGCIVDPATMPTTFKSVHLPDSTIDSIRSIVSLPLLYPEAFNTGILKTHSMTGALLFGPPGTGKTLLARAIARESGARMMIIKPSDVMDMYVGEGEKLVRSVFTLARRLSPAVLFLDEIDSLFGSRVSNRDTGGTTAHRGIITEFMQEMDGLKSSKEQNVIVIGATNRPFDLDDAVLRRLPRRILVDLPGPKEREEILKILLRDETLALDVDLKDLASRTEAFSGSDLKHLCVAAALDAVKEGVDVPWAVPSKANQPPVQPSTDSEASPIPALSPEPEPDSAPQESSSPSASENAMPTTASESAFTPPSSPTPTPAPALPRILSSRHFTKALKEITPSASESLGTLSSLRRWNEEFGEGNAAGSGPGGKGRKRKAWGDKFGFGTPKSKEEEALRIGTSEPGPEPGTKPVSTPKPASVPVVEPDMVPVSPTPVPSSP